MPEIETIRQGRSLTVYVTGDPPLRNALLESETETGDVQSTRGRGRTRILPLEGDRRAVLRVLQHGGLMGRLFGRLFVGSSRVLREFLLLIRARERGAPVIKPLAARTFRFFSLFYAGELVTEECKALTLGELIEKNPPEDLRPLLVLLLGLHRSGVKHTDLNIHNILVPDDGRPWLALDLDGGTLEPVLEWQDRLAQLLRLDRSYEKAFGVGGPVNWLRRYRFLHHYMKQIGMDPRLALKEIRRERQRRSWRRLLWALNG